MINTKLDSLIAPMFAIAAFLIFTVGGMDLNSKAVALSTIAVFASVVTILQMKTAIRQTEESIKLTKETIIKAEIEQQKRDIEKRFDYFYYPLRDYLVFSNVMEFDLTIKKFGYYRYLATDRTREQYLTYITYRDKNNRNLLVKYLTGDIKSLEGKLKELNNEYNLFQ